MQQSPAKRAKMILRLSLIVLLCVLREVSHVEACGGCSTCALSDPACIPTEMKAEYVPYTKGWWFTKRSGYRAIYKYYKGAPYCCGGYVLDGLTCHTAAMSCGGCDGTGVSTEAACVQHVQQKTSRRSVVSYRCAAWWWTSKTCYRTDIFYVLVRKPIKTCCAGYLLNGDNCVKDNSPKTCGVSKYVEPGVHQTLIVGGADALPNEFPWQLRIELDGSGICGGVLIGAEWVLTAAHCAHEYVNSAGRISVIAGDHLFKNYDSTEQLRYGMSVFVHGEFNMVSYVNDIAVIRVNPPFDLNENVNPACLPQTCDEVYVDKQVIISGWGRSSAGSRDTAIVRPNALQYAFMVVKPRNYCNMYSGPTDTIICCSDNLGDNQKSPCFGDSGGPMVLKMEDGHYTVIGIASFVADRGCAEGLPSGYTDIRPYLRWLKQIVF